MPEGLLECEFSQASGSYYDPLPWSECHEDPPSLSTKLTGVWPMCIYDAGGTCLYYEELCRKVKEAANA